MVLYSKMSVGVTRNLWSPSSQSTGVDRHYSPLGLVHFYEAHITFRIYMNLLVVYLCFVNVC